MGVAKEQLQAKISGEDGVLAHLDVLIVGEGFARGLRDGEQLAGEGLAHALGVLDRQVAQEGVAGDAFDQNTDCGAVARTHDQVAFVVPGDQPVLDFGGPLIDEHHVFDAIFAGDHAPALGFPNPMLAAQTRGQLTLEFTARHHVNVAVNRFAGSLHEPQAGIVSLGDACDLLRRPAPTQLGMHFVAQRRMAINGATSPAGYTGLIGRRRPVMFAPAIAREFATDRARRPVQSHGHRKLRVTRPYRRLQLDSFGHAQRTVFHRVALRRLRRGSP